MQVSPVAPPVAAAVAGQARLLLLPDILNITRLSPQAQALRQQRQAERDSEQRRRNDEAEPPVAAAAAAELRPSAADLANQAERNMAPGSRACRDNIISHQQQKAAAQKDAFQRSLADAAARQNATASQPVSAARSDADADGGARDTAATRETVTAKTGAAAEPAKPTAATAVTTPQTNTTMPLTATKPAVEPQRVPTVAGAATAATNSANPPASLPSANAQAVAPLLSATSAGGASTASAPQSSASTTQTTAVAASASAPQSNSAARTVGRPVAAEGGPDQAGANDANFERILRVVRAQISENRTRTTLQLDPPQLGKIRLQLDLHHDALTLRVEPHTELAYRLLSKQLDSLRDGLHATGIHLEHVEVRPPAASAAPENPGLPQYSGGHAGGGAQAETDHPQHSGTESPAAGRPETAAREANSEPSAEPRVNVWA